MPKPPLESISRKSISHKDVEAFLSCPVKLDLLSKEVGPSDPEFVEGAALTDKILRPIHLSYLNKRHQVSAYNSELHDWDFLQTVTDSQVILDWPISVDGYSTKLDALMVAVSRAGKQILPVRFCAESKVTELVRTLLCFDSLVLKLQFGYGPVEGLVVVGWEARSSNVTITNTLQDRLNKCLKEIQCSQIATPAVRLNRHCAVCQFQKHCLAEAQKADDLSLIMGMNAKEQDRMRNRGIFTVNQFSYTFRMRRNKRALSIAERRSHALTALAIREQKTFVLGEPKFAFEVGDAFVDVEGDPSRGFYYLIGIAHYDHDEFIYRVLWADSADEEGRIFRDFLGYLAEIGCKRIIHYGAFESECFKQMLATHELPPSTRESFQSISNVNLLKTIYEHIYFPCRSNSLKEIGTKLGAVWRQPASSGARANFWRLEWETTLNNSWKNKLVDYNEDDCRALAVVAKAVANLSEGAAPKTQADSTDAPLEGLYSRGFANEEFKAISRAAYWDRQRALIYVGSNRKKSKTSRKKNTSLLKRPSRVLEVPLLISWAVGSFGGRPGA